ncbi:hypothetical protein BFP70_12005 [Thioclava sp. SK-1]|uniref:TniB family NTP-binding protein n=1 Tax=Thioclava sp. SK-1 TaxID=1889770 RepID=UPI000825FCEF|nr:TniB family NTP-binding protein [Thioclava sp. SK-1]OCX63723.1 hypothetical protein BFP70_12005 [Thioclava sp. SK-1]
MTLDLQIGDAERRIQTLRRDVFIEHPDAQRIARQIESALRGFLAAKEVGHPADARGVVILGRSGTGKTRSVLRTLGALGMQPTKVGDYPRHHIFVSLDDRVSLRRLRLLISEQYGRTPRSRDSAGDIWRYVAEFIDRLETRVIVLDEIQHVRTAGPQDRQSVRDALKSLVQPQSGQVVPILIGTPGFAEILNSDQQLRRRYSVVHMTNLDPGADARRAIQVLAHYAKKVGVALGTSVQTRDFAERLLHASYYALGELCEICILALSGAISAGDNVLEIEHFRITHAERFDCIPELNPFIAEDFANIPTDEDPEQ